MEKSKRNTTMLIIITIAVFLVAVLGATFAYFATERNVGSAINANVGTAASMYSFSATSTDKIEMDIAFNEMSQVNVNNTVLKSDSATIDVSLASPTDDTLTTCTYDIVWVWDDGDRYKTPDKALPFTDGGKEYNYEFSTKVDGANEKDLSNLEADGKTVKIQSGLSITSSSTTTTTRTHEIKANIYNLPVEQTNLFNKKFKAHVTIDNLSCHMESNEVPAGIPLATYIINDVYKSDANQTSIAAKQAGLYYHDSDTTSATHLANGAADNTYRYAGADANVNNYVCFQEEGMDCNNKNNLYRIISVDSNTNQTKVIKAKSLGRMKWNEMPANWDNVTPINNWEGSSLETYLNGTYLTNLGDKANKIVDTTWKVGGYTWAQNEVSNAKQIYDLEMASTPKVDRKIGLMYVHEYMYAALPEYWTLVGYNRSDATKDHRASYGKDWILTNADYYDPWTISRNSGSTSYAFTVGSDFGRVANGYVGSDSGYDVRPSFSLTSDVKITNAGDGVGTKANPMIIV